MVAELGNISLEDNVSASLRGIKPMEIALRGTKKVVQKEGVGMG